MSKYLNVIPQYKARNKKLKIKGLTYKQYLASNEWYWLKEYAKRRLLFNYCNCCGRLDNLHIHHKTYKNINKPIGRQIGALSCLCAGCHKTVHDLTQTHNYSLRSAVKKLKKIKQKELNKTVPHFDLNVYCG